MSEVIQGPPVCGPALDQFLGFGCTTKKQSLLFGRLLAHCEILLSGEAPTGSYRAIIERDIRQANKLIGAT